MLWTTSLESLACASSGPLSPVSAIRHSGRHEGDRLQEGRCYHCPGPSGNWREEHLFALRQAVELFDSYQEKLRDCDQKILDHLHTMEDRSDIGTSTPPKPMGGHPRKNELTFDGAMEAYRMSGVDLTKITGIKGHTAMKILSEIGTDVAHWPTAGHFASWLTLAPKNRISGGKRLP